MKSDTYFVQAKEYAAELRLGAIKSDLEESIPIASINIVSSGFIIPFPVSSYLNLNK